jgi:type IV pilus assembly protein PilO
MPRSQLEKAWLGAGLLVALVVALIGYLFFIGPQRSTTSDVDGQIGAAQSQNDTLQIRISSLDAQNRKLSTYRAALKQARMALPATSDLPNFLRSLQSLGNATLADVTTLSVGDPLVVGGDATTTAPTTPAPTTSSAPDPTAGTAPATATAPTGPQIFALPITAQVTGSIKQLTDFLGQLQSVQPRAVLVSSITLGGATTGASANTSTLDLTLEAFVAPGSAVETQQLAQAVGK